MVKGALFSNNRKYRYTLWRIWDTKKRMVSFIGLNPSTADENIDDPTVRRCINYAKDWGYGGLYMLNIFAFRATDPKVMKRELEPIGPRNDETIVKYTNNSRIVIASWGNHGTHLSRDKAVIRLIGRHNLLCLGKSKGGNPKHPLYLRKDLTPTLF